MTLEIQNSSTKINQHMATSYTSKTQFVQELNNSSSSSYGYMDSPSEDDGYYTSAVSVQHKLLSSEHHEVSSDISSSTSDQIIQNGRKVVWPNFNLQVNKERINDEIHHHMQNGNSHRDDEVDHPLAWMKGAATKDTEHEIRRRAEQMEMDIQKRTFDIGKSNRMSRSRSRSNQIMERARSFDRLAEQVRSNPDSRPPSRARGRRSPSLGRQLNESWIASHSRPESRSGFDPPQRCRSMGKIDVTPWETRIRDASPQAPLTGQGPRRKHLEHQMHTSNRAEVLKPDFPRNQVNAQWPPPPPPPPPPPATIQPSPQREPSPPPPPLPPPPPMTSSDLSSESVRMLSEEETSKDQIVQEWVRQTSHHHQQHHHHQQQYQHKVQQHSQVKDEDLEKFAYSIAETLVSNMEKSAVIQSKNESEEKSFSGVAHAFPAQANYEEDLKKTNVEKENRRHEDHQHHRVEIQTHNMESEKHPKNVETKALEEKKLRFIEQHKQTEERYRPTTPKLIRKSSFDASNDSKVTKNEQFTEIRTGQVEEKRNFWIRSASTERLNARHEMSPGPRRRLNFQPQWIRPQDVSDSSRPGSSLAQLSSDQNLKNVKQAVSSFSQLSKSKSSAAVLQENKGLSRSRSGQIKALASGWNNDRQGLADSGKRQSIHQEVHTHQVQDTVTELTKKAADVSSGRNTPTPFENRGRQVKLANAAQPWTQQSSSAGKSLRYDEVHTNQVQDTIQEFGKKHVEGSGRTTPVPTRNIGEVFADGKVVGQTKKRQNLKEEPVSIAKVTASPWRTGSKAHEPSLKLVNVSVEKPANIHISENAHAQMASFMHQDSKKESKFSSSSSSTIVSTSSSVQTSEVRKESKSFHSSETKGSSYSTQVVEEAKKDDKIRLQPEDPASSQIIPDEGRVVQVPPRSPGPVRKPTPTKEKGKVTHPDPAEGAVVARGGASPKSTGKRHVEITEIASYQHKETHESTKSNSTSSGQIPMPIAQQWFEPQPNHPHHRNPPPHQPSQKQQQLQQKLQDQHHQIILEQQKHQRQHNEQSLSKSLQQPNRHQEGPKSTPLPVLAGWFEDCEKLNQNEGKRQPEAEPDVTLKGKVRDNLAIFQQPGSHTKPATVSNIELIQDCCDTVKEGRVNNTKKAYIQRATSNEREDNSKQQRAKEIEEVLRARNESGGKSQELDDPERIFSRRQRDERERELQEVAQLRATAIGHNVWEETDAHERAEVSRLQRARELQELAQSRQKLNWNDVVSQSSNNKQLSGAEETLGDSATGLQSSKVHLDKELQGISTAQSKEYWTNLTTGAADPDSRKTPSKMYDPDQELEEARILIRSAASAWHESDRQARSEMQDNRPAPTRRIANLFSKNSDHWQMNDYDEEFPAPPTVEDFTPSSQPSPPPRDSSKEIMMKCKGNSGNWTRH